MRVAEILFGMSMALISIGGTVIVIMLIVRAIQHGRSVRESAFKAALEKGIYDPTILHPGPNTTGAASLGWGIFFAAVGVALLIGFAALGIFGDALLGGLIPLAIGIGLLLFHAIMKRSARDVERNGKPIRFDGGAAPERGSTTVQSSDHENLGG